MLKKGIIKKYLLGNLIRYILFIVFLSFISFYIISKTVDPEMVPSDVSTINPVGTIGGEGLYSEETPDGNEGISSETPQLPLDEDRGIVYESEREWTVVSHMVREVSAYNAGDVNQCWGDPCESASGDNICKLLEEGVNVCAANWTAFGTIIEIEGLGKCVVLDRMAGRFPLGVDWAMKLDEKQKAFDFGRRNLMVKIVEVTN